MNRKNTKLIQKKSGGPVHAEVSSAYTWANITSEGVRLRAGRRSLWWRSRGRSASRQYILKDDYYWRIWVIKWLRFYTKNGSLIYQKSRWSHMTKNDLQLQMHGWMCFLSGSNTLSKVCRVCTLLVSRHPGTKFRKKFGRYYGSLCFPKHVAFISQKQ